MRHTITALVALTLVACAAEEVPPRERLTFERIERAFESTVATSTPVRAAEGNVFVIVHLIEDPARKEERKWIHSIMEDWDGRTYQARFAGVRTRESENTGLFGRRIKTVHPDRIQVVFEVPQTSALRSVTVPHPISLFETPTRISEPRSAPRVVRRVEPHYPEAARRRGVDGLVKLEALVMPDGTVAGARHIHGPTVLGEAAAAAVRQWKYEPLVVDGRAVPALIQVHITFRVGP
jgi:TonB family protein